MPHLVSSIPAEKKFSVWFTQGFSSQRDLLVALKNSSLQPYLKTIGSHRQYRDEILSMADFSMLEPSVDYHHFVLAQAIKNGVQLVIASHNHEKYEELRPLFEQQGIILITGTQGLNNHYILENKFEFGKMCKQAGIPVADSIQVNTTTQLIAAIECIKEQNKQIQVCVKPVTGVFAQGFWQLRDDIEYFHSLFDPTSYQVNTQQFIEAYDQLPSKPPYLVMPFLSGDECSVDMFCASGKLMNKVTRIKKEQWQEVLPKGPCDEMAQQLAQLFKLDGIVNAQFRQDRAGKWHVLEINTRPSGGIGITVHSQVNLVAECVAYHARLPLIKATPRHVLVRQINTSVEVKPIDYSAELNYA